MENIIDLSLPLENRTVQYHVVFENERYTFTAINDDVKPQTFNICREQNEWVSPEPMDEELKKQQLKEFNEVAEGYLLK